MHNKQALILSTVALLAATGPAAWAGAVVSSGNVTRELGSAAFIDTASGRAWLGADVTKYFNYQQTLDQLRRGGQFEGYAIATYADVAQLVVDFSLPGTGSCQNVDYGWGDSYASCQGQTSASGVQVFGQSYSHGDWDRTYNQSYNYGWFLSDTAAGSTPSAGILQVYSYGGDANYISADKSWGTTASTDWYAGGDSGIGWMLYRTSAARVDAVPEPGSLALVALALGGLLLVRRRRALLG